MDLLSVGEAAEVLGVSRQRLHQLIHAGQLDAARVGKNWVVDDEVLADFQAARRPRIRPMSGRVARAMVDLIGQHCGAEPGQSWVDLPHRERSRLRQRWEQLVASDHPALLLRAWLPNRCSSARFTYRGDVREIFDDPRVEAGGAAHPELGLSGGLLVEPHVSDVDRDAVVWDFLLTPDPQGTVLLRAEPVVRVDLAACLADVAEVGGGRNDKAVAEVLARVMPR